MYIGRFVIVSPTVGAYRVSSRSFPNRQMIELDGETRTVVPTDDAPATTNPYVSYNCTREAGDRVVIGNGSHVDPIAEKLDLGYPERDALAEALLALDYEKDEYDTPRIAGILGSPAVIGIVRRDALIVRTVDEPTIVATYETTTPEPIEFDAQTPTDAAEAAYHLDYDHPVCSIGVTVDPAPAYAILNTPEHEPSRP